MGSGSVDVKRATTRSATMNYASKSSREIFDKRELQNAMNPEGIKVRESRDSDEHPESLAIIIALDLTGSMGHIPKSLITSGLVDLMATIIQRGIEDPQVLLMGIGDHECDRAPLQVAQFESSDELLDKWFKEIYLEGGGGGNAGESYPLAWYFAGNHTAIDCLEKRDKKGYLFTIGDEPPLTEFPKDHSRHLGMEQIMGETLVMQEDSIHASKWLEKAKEMYHVKHLNLRETNSGGRPETLSSWKQILGEDAINVADYEELPKVIAEIIIRGETGDSVDIEETVIETETDGEVIL